jgi:predicted Zn-dependent protease
LSPARLACGLGALALACAAPAPVPPHIPAWNEGGAAIVVEDDERQLWRESEAALEALRKESALLEDPALLGYLDGVLAALTPDGLPAEAPRPRVAVTRSTERNAGAFSDGLVLISTGFLAALADEAQAAAAFSHEVAHFLARDPLSALHSRRQSASTVTRMTLSRAREEEADRLGLELMERAGYDPHGMIEMLTLLGSEQKAPARGEAVFASHPFTTERTRALEAAMPRTAGGSGRRDAARYESAIANLLLVEAQLELDADQLDRAGAAIERHLRLRPNSGHAYYLKAERERRVAPEGRHAPAVREAYERAIALAPDDADALRALGFLCRESGEAERSRELFRRYLAAAPDAKDRKLIERYLGEAP